MHFVLNKTFLLSSLLHFEFFLITKNPDLNQPPGNPSNIPHWWVVSVVGSKGRLPQDVPLKQADCFELKTMKTQKTQEGTLTPISPESFSPGQVHSGFAETEK